MDTNMDTNMPTDTQTSTATTQYAAAYATHYSTKDLSKALGQYSALISDYPDTPEAGYSRAQIVDIAKAVVPTDDLIDAHLALAFKNVATSQPATTPPDTQSS